MSKGGARRGAGRKKGIGVSIDIQRYCEAFIKEMLLNDAIKLKATKQLSLSLEEKDNILYIIKSNNTYKIGYTSNWRNRYRMYKVHTHDCELIYLIKTKNAFDLELDLHNMFKDKIKLGEWFNLSDKDLIKAISYCSSNIK